MNEAKALHQMNPKSRFTNRAEDYAKYRPSYPDEVIDRIVAELDNVPESVAVDVGAGTGISSRLLADRAIKVIAIEPNEAMRQAAEAHPLVEFREGGAEDTGLDDASVDLVTCFQSFHWFDPEPTLKEFARILKPEGKLAVIWNNQNREDEFTNEYSKSTKIASSYDTELRFGIEKFFSDLGQRGEKFSQNSILFDSALHLVYSNQQILNLQALVGRALSNSYAPRSEIGRNKLVRDLHQIHQRYADEHGLVYLQYKTNLYLTGLSNQ